MINVIKDKKKIVPILIASAVGLLSISIFIFFILPDSKKPVKKGIGEVGVEHSPSERYRQKIEEGSGEKVTKLEQEIVDEQTLKEIEKKERKKEKIDPLVVMPVRPNENLAKAVGEQITPLDVFIQNPVAFSANGGMMAEQEKPAATKPDKDTKTAFKYRAEIEPYKLYRGMLITSLISTGLGRFALIEIIEPGPLRRWRLVTIPQYDAGAERFFLSGVEIRSPDGHSEPVMAEVFSIDETPGVISAVRFDDLPWLIASMITDGVSDALLAYADRGRKRKVIIGPLGVPVIEEETDDRAFETKTILARGGSSLVGKTLSSYLKKNIRGIPTGLAQKGTPVFVMFYDQRVKDAITQASLTTNKSENTDTKPTETRKNIDPTTPVNRIIDSKYSDSDGN